ncbi:MAG: ribosome-associated translation inhibitor RaiA [Firmicutes bacterium]|nr:ribosome-associated translation inhibitor RaiA [Bacillota bacterium]
MQFTVAGKNLQVTPALREHAERKVKKLLKFFDGDRHAIMADLVLSCQRDRQQAEITLRVGGLIVRGVGNTDDMYVSIDQAVDRIERQIRKFKTRIQQRLQERPRPAAAAEEPASSPEAQEESDQPRVVRVKRFAIKPMTVDEAVLQMELLGHDFFVFTNAATDEVNVLYRRQAGDYGLIEPEF